MKIKAKLGAMLVNKLAFGQNPKMILLLLFAGNLFSALDRFVINYGIVHISDDLQLSASSTGLILSIFFLGYAIMQIPGGWMADRFGARIVLIVSVFSFTIFTSLTGLAWSLYRCWSFVLCSDWGKEVSFLLGPK